MNTSYPRLFLVFLSRILLVLGTIALGGCRAGKPQRPRSPPPRPRSACRWVIFPISSLHRSMLPSKRATSAPKGWRSAWITAWRRIMWHWLGRTTCRLPSSPVSRCYWAAPRAYRLFTSWLGIAITRSGSRCPRVWGAHTGRFARAAHRSARLVRRQLHRAARPALGGGGVRGRGAPGSHRIQPG